jgi:quinol monooxygenase YgiN
MGEQQVDHTTAAESGYHLGQGVEHGVEHGGEHPSGDVVPVMVVLGFRTDRPAELMDILARYVVSSRGRPGCRNIDYAISATDPQRLLIVEKWESAQAQRVHFDSPEMVEMAEAAVPLLSGEPDIDIFHGISMLDLA